MATHTTTPLGKFLRKFRVEHDETMRNMASKLGFSSSFLSAIERGRKDPPSGLTEDIVDLYGLGAQMAQDLEAAAAASRQSITIKAERPEIRMMLARLKIHANNLTADETRMIDDILLARSL